MSSDGGRPAPRRRGGSTPPASQRPFATLPLRRSFLPGSIIRERSPPGWASGRPGRSTRAAAAPSKCGPAAPGRWRGPGASASRPSGRPCAASRWRGAPRTSAALMPSQSPGSPRLAPFLRSGLCWAATSAGMKSSLRTRCLPPWMKLRPFQFPDSRVTGASPARLAARHRVSIPSSGKWTISPAAVMSEMPGMEVKISARRSKVFSSSIRRPISASMSFNLPQPLLGDPLAHGSAQVLAPARRLPLSPVQGDNQTPSHAICSGLRPHLSHLPPVQAHLRIGKD